MRLFVGIALSLELRHALEQFTAGVKREAPGLRWSPPEQWHITLQFLGAVSEPDYTCVVKQLYSIRATPVDIALREPGFFERAKIFHVQVHPSSALLALHHKVENSLVPCGFEPEARPYSPHVTLARDKGSRLSPDFRHLQQTIMDSRSAKAFPSFSATEFLLYESFTEASGPRYEVRERFPLM
jgi:RNA 2',3'-cyclic 3'-phosphodiesterase